MSNQGNTNPQNEPTMEEILASIRKIISEDQPAEGAKSTPRPAAPAKPQSSPVASVSAPAADLDVLDLTEEVREEAPAPAPIAPKVSAPVPAPAPTPAAGPAPVLESDEIFQNIEPAPKAQERPMDDDFISDTTRSAMGRAFNTFSGQTPQVALKDGSIESIFQDAVQQAFRSALKEWVDDHSGDVMDQLRPLIRAWMDEHLPPLIEAAVIKEISRAATRKP